MKIPISYPVILLVTLFFSTAQCESSTVVEHWYKEVTADTHERFLWSKISGEQVYLSSTKENEKTSLICLPGGEVLQWQQEDNKGTFLTARRSADGVSIVGKRDGIEIEKRFELDDKPWYQFLSFSLRSFLEDSGADKITFWMLREDILEPVLIEATKAGSEDIVLGHDIKVSTLKVKISPSGFKGKFWHAHYWYRLPDFLFVMYKGTHGGLLTPETVMTLDLQSNTSK